MSPRASPAAWTRSPWTARCGWPCRDASPARLSAPGPAWTSRASLRSGACAGSRTWPPPGATSCWKCWVRWASGTCAGCEVRSGAACSRPSSRPRPSEGSWAMKRVLEVGPERRLERVIAKHTHALRRGFNSWAALDYGRPPALGDARWTDDLILATWRQSETGRPPERLEHQAGRSGGGFDALDFRFLPPERRLAAG